MNTFNSISEIVCNVSAKRVSIKDPTTLNASSRLADDLGADSLDLIKIVVELESLTGVRLKDEEVMTFSTLGDIINALYDKQNLVR